VRILRILRTHLQNRIYAYRQMTPSPARTNPSAYLIRKRIPLRTIRTIRRIQPTRAFVRIPLTGNPPARKNPGSGTAATAHAPLLSDNPLVPCSAATAPIFGESPNPMATPIWATAHRANRRRLQDFGITISATATHLSQPKTHRNNEQCIHHLPSPKKNRSVYKEDRCTQPSFASLGSATGNNAPRCRASRPIFLAAGAVVSASNRGPANEKPPLP
jgi:hypothetical protein